MKNLLLVTAVICSALVAVRANPVPEARPDPNPEPKTDIELMKIPLEGDKELDVITLVNSDDQKINERNKRTIGILRELFPTISQILDQKIQMITSYLFRTIGPILLRSGLGGGAGGDNAGSRGSTDDDFDDDFDDDDDDKNISSDNGRKVSISLPTFPPSTDDDDSDDDKASDGSTVATTESDENEIRKRSAALRATTDALSSLSTLSPTTTDSVAPSTGSSSAEQTTTTRTKAQESTETNLV